MASVAATGPDHHVAVLAQDDVVAAVVVEHRGGAQLGGCAARLGDRVWLHQVHLAGERVAGRGVRLVGSSWEPPQFQPLSSCHLGSDCSSCLGSICTCGWAGVGLGSAPALPSLTCALPAALRPSLGTCHTLSPQTGQLRSCLSPARVLALLPGAPAALLPGSPLLPSLPCISVMSLMCLVHISYFWSVCPSRLRAMNVQATPADTQTSRLTLGVSDTIVSQHSFTLITTRQGLFWAEDH